MSRLEQDRERMIEKQMKARGITDARLLAAFQRVPRERFVWDADQDQAYADQPVRIGCGQTISQPYMVALMTQQLAVTAKCRVLEVGTGSGYQTCILAELAAEVYTIERHEELTESAHDRLEQLGYTNVTFAVGDGTLGWLRHAPFDRIIVTAGAPRVPSTLKEQLVDGGRLVVPVGEEKKQTLVTIERRGDTFTENRGTECLFVKLVGEQGWTS